METTIQDEVIGTDAEAGLRWLAPGLADIYVDLWAITSGRHLERPSVLVAHGIREIMNVLARIVTYEERLKNRKFSPEEQICEEATEGTSGASNRPANGEFGDAKGGRESAGKEKQGDFQRTLHDHPSQVSIHELRCPRNGRECVSYALKHEEYRKQVTHMYKIIWGVQRGEQAIGIQVDAWIALHDEVMDVVHPDDGMRNKNELQMSETREWLSRLKGLLGNLFHSYLQDAEDVHALLDKANS